MRKLRVLEMIDKPFLGGGQIHLLSLARGLDKSRFEVMIAAQSGGPLEDAARAEGIGFLPIVIGKKLRRGAVRDLADRLTENGIDILHTHGGVAGLFGRWAARRARTPVIVHTLHGIHYLHYRNPLLKRLYVLQERHFSRRTDAVIFVSEADLRTGKKFRLAPQDRSRLIRNGVDLSGMMKEQRTASRIEKLKAALNLGPLVVGAIARLHRQKGIEFLVAAAKEIHALHPEVRIVVVGGGPLEKSLRRRAANLGLGRNFLLFGERGDAREVLSLFDIFVLPSLWEGLPLALIEAASLGKAIVATDIDGVREVVRDGETGLLVPPGDPARLAGAVVRLLEDRRLAARLGERAIKEIPPLFTLAEMVEKTERLYLELAALKMSL
ncbi:MAG: glycosyltransferase family 4 protein [Candidatus Aminicenantes bacterium]|nr:glycosyltransferase family 4 protein [Candidatus Aminicenantes bacterium]